MNRNLSPQKSTLFKNKLIKILENINRIRGEESLQTKEAYLLEAVKILTSFYLTVSQSNFIPEKVRAGTSPEADLYNQNFLQILDDLEILFLELENVEGVALEHFNLFTAHANRLNSRIKKLNSRVTDFTLFSGLPVKNSIFFSDTFSDLSRIDPKSALLNAEECLVNEEEGIITLPINTGGSSILEVTLTPLINTNSNGRAGNNEEIGSPLNNNISAILDSNADTWFEYERVVTTDDQVPLTLDFTINLGEADIINFIKINPNNFGAKTEIEILDISTSKDGQLYLSIKDDIPITGFIFEDEENVFKLAPSTSKFAGQGIYTFTPRYAKYVRVILRQSTPYLIQTVTGQQFRYAIGIRDIEIEKVAYSGVGEIVSLPYQATDEIKKIALKTSQKPSQSSELVSIKHQVSLDNGNSWHDISPLEDKGFINIDTVTPEILNINTEDANSIKTDSPVFTIRYKAILERLDEGFTNGSTAFADEIIDVTELKSVPQTQPWMIEIDRKPITDSVSVIDPSYGSRGKTDIKFLVGKGTGGALSLQIPFSDLKLDSKKTLVGSDWVMSKDSIEIVYVNGEEWTPVPTLATSSSTDKEYAMKFNSDNTISLLFGDGVTGVAPPLNALIEMTFTPERIYPTKKSEHTATFLFPTSIDKQSFQVSRKGPVVTGMSLAEKSNNIHRLEHRNIVSEPSFTPAGQTIFTQLVEFEPTLSNLSSAGDYCINNDTGVIYSLTPVGEDESITISYQYQTEEVLTNAQWDWADSNTVHNSIKINDDAWSPYPYTGFLIASGINFISLPSLSVVEGSIQFIPPGTIDEEDDPFLVEVPYLNGNAELNNLVNREEEIPTLTPVGPSDVASFTLSTPITSSLSFNAAFDNTEVFTTEVFALIDVTATGEYFIDRSTSVVTVWTDGESIESPGKITYWSNDPGRVPAGAYSVNYKNGLVFMQRPVPVSGYVVNYQYSDYIIRYNIARIVPEEDWELDPSAGTIAVQGTELVQKAAITILPNEIIRKSKSPASQGVGIFTPIVYQINYKYIGKVRDSIEELALYFTPSVKDYALQIITKGFI
jgi:hypothetical protein